MKKRINFYHSALIYCLLVLVSCGSSPSSNTPATITLSGIPTIKDKNKGIIITPNISGDSIVKVVYSLYDEKDESKVYFSKTLGKPYTLSFKLAAFNIGDSSYSLMVKAQDMSNQTLATVYTQLQVKLNSSGVNIYLSPIPPVTDTTRKITVIPRGYQARI